MLTLWLNFQFPFNYNILIVHLKHWHQVCTNFKYFTKFDLNMAKFLHRRVHFLQSNDTSSWIRIELLSASLVTAAGLNFKISLTNWSNSCNSLHSGSWKFTLGPYNKPNKQGNSENFHGHEPPQISMGLIDHC